MKLFLINLWNHNSVIAKWLLFVCSAIIIVFLFPTDTSYNLEYKTGKPWLHQDVITNFDFPILKSDIQLKLERKKLLKKVHAYYYYDDEVAIKSKRKVQKQLKSLFKDKQSISQQALLLSNSLLDSIYCMGLIRYQDDEVAVDSVFIVRNGIASLQPSLSFYTVKKADEFLRSEIRKNTNDNIQRLLPVLQDALDYNVKYNSSLTNQMKNETLRELSYAHGIVQSGEKVISQGEIVTPYKHNVLKSYQEQHSINENESVDANFAKIGQYIVVGIILFLLVVFLKFLRKDIFQDNKKISLILLMLVLSVLFTSFVINYNMSYMYLVPICISPIVMRVFFDTRLATFVHIITIVLLGIMVPNSFEFLFIQLVAGVIVIVSMLNLQKRIQFIIAGILVFLSYSISYTAFKLMNGVPVRDLNFGLYLQFAANGAFILMAYPVIFLYEWLFGYVTDVSLMELSDTNSKLLREFSRKAPGTFQHSLRVANIAEEIVRSINGKALLVRTGALYHDIGKMEAPLYFTENQLPGVNPHDDISYDDSAKVIISHVLMGVEKARKNNLPEQVIDFIRTHHGTTKARYFYVLKLRETTEHIDEQAFTYPGPIPYSRETAVLMLIDAVEAASRSIKQPNEQNINELVEKIVEDKIQTGQLINSSLTFKDIEIIKKILKKQLLTIFHIRIEYPEMIRK